MRLCCGRSSMPMGPKPISYRYHQGLTLEDEQQKYIQTLRSSLRIEVARDHALRQMVIKRGTMRSSKGKPVGGDEHRRTDVGQNDVLALTGVASYSIVHGFSVLSEIFRRTSRTISSRQKTNLRNLRRSRTPLETAGRAKTCTSCGVSAQTDPR